jgi:hypothetical protein
MCAVTRVRRLDPCCGVANSCLQARIEPDGNLHEWHRVLTLAASLSDPQSIRLARDLRRIHLSVRDVERLAAAQFAWLTPDMKRHRFARLSLVSR